MLSSNSTSDPRFVRSSRVAPGIATWLVGIVSMFALAAWPGAARAQPQYPPSPRVVQVTPTPGITVGDGRGLDQVVIRFSENVVIPPASVRVWAVRRGEIVDFVRSYDPATFTLRVTFQPPIRDDRVSVVLDYSIANTAGTPLDGETGSPRSVTFPTGDGVPGGQAVFEIGSLLADWNRSGNVNSQDFFDFVRDFFDIGIPDFNRDGLSNTQDFFDFIESYFLNDGASLAPTDGTAPLITSISPAPDTRLDAPLPSMTINFSEPIAPVRMIGRTLLLVGRDGTLYPASSVALSPDNRSATFAFTPPLARCDRYTINISNAVADPSGEPLLRDITGPVISGTVPPPVPTLNPYTIATNQSSIMLSGVAPMAQQVELVGPAGVFTFPVNPGTGAFSVNMPLGANRANLIYIAGLSPCGVRSAPASASVIMDATPPSLFIDFPTDGAEIAASTTDVAGRVSDTLSGFMGLSVTVNGLPATVNEGIGTNGTFFRQGLSLPPDTATTFNVVATDALGNSATRTVTVSRVMIPQDAAIMTPLASSNGQSGPVNTPLPNVLRVTVTRAGQPIANKVVTFEVTRSDGTLATSAGPQPGSQMLQVLTDSNGHARAYWTLGSEAGMGNNRVCVTSRDIAGTVVFCASATPALPDQINIGSGNNQRGEVGAPLAMPLRAWVSDSCNGIESVPVTFTVVQGGGTLHNLVTGQSGSVITVPSMSTGHAEVGFALGDEPGNQAVAANFVGNPNGPATFLAFAVRRDPFAAGSFAGTVFDNASQPLGGAGVRLLVNGVLIGSTFTDAQGQFRINNVSVGGAGDLYIDSESITTLGGAPLPSGTRFPPMHYEIPVIADAPNALAMPILLPPLLTVNDRIYSGTQTQDLVLRCDGIDGLEFIVRAGTVVRLADGTLIGPDNPGQVTLSINQVHHDNIPMPMPDGVAPPFAWTFQPAGAHFDPPVQVVYPNMSALPPGAIANFLSFNHDTNRFDIVASGTVSPDGQSIRSDPGVGIPVSGWGCNCPPYAVTGDCDRCRPQPNGCGPAGSNIIIRAVLTCLPMPAAGGGVRIVCFFSSCNAHDVCYGSCSTGPGHKAGCDNDFLRDMGFDCIRGCGLDPVCLAACAARAVIYYKAVSCFGDDAYNSSQDELNRNGCCGQAGGFPQDPPLPFGPPYVDNDNDILPDDWEVSMGLDPTDPSDALADFDGDGLENVSEFLAITDPFTADTDINGLSDLEDLLAIQPPPVIPLDDRWVVTVGGQTANVGPTGLFKVSNIVAPDQFGEGGPGTPPDFVSDDGVRVVGSANIDGTTYYVFSDPFRVGRNFTLSIDDLFITDVPPALAQSIRIDTQNAVIQPGQTTQLNVIGTLADGSTRDFTRRQDWTTYRSSNPDIAYVEQDGDDTDGVPDGTVVAVSVGTVFITASNDAATAVRRIFVTESARQTTVQGFVVNDMAQPISGAIVSANVLGGSVMTGPDGRFVLPVTYLPDDNLRITITALAEVDGLTRVAVAANLLPINNGVTDAGILSLRPLCDPSWGAGFDSAGFDGPVLAMLTVPAGSGTIQPGVYAAGGFSAVGGVGSTPLNRIAFWDGSAWRPVGAGFNGDVHALALFPTQTGPTLIAAGDFTMAGMTPVARVAMWDGTSWLPMSTGMNDTVTSLAVVSGAGGPQLFAGGWFTSASGNVSSRVARWSGSSWQSLGAGVNRAVYALASYDSGSGPQLHVAGDFTFAGGQPANRLARWDGNAWAAISTGANAPIRALASFADGPGPALYLGGDFTSIGGVAASRLARYNGVGFSPVGAGLNAPVRALAPLTSTGTFSLYVAGDFTQAGPVVAARAAVWNGATWQPLGTGVNSTARAAAVLNDPAGPILFLGGDFTLAGSGPVGRAARFSTVEGWDGFGRGLDGQVRAFASLPTSASSSSLIVAGSFSSAGNRFAGNIAAWDGSEWSDLAGGVNDAVFAATTRMESGGTALYVGGVFDRVGTAPGIPANLVARYHNGVWSPLGTGVNGTVRALHFHDDGTGQALYAAGDFTSAGGPTGASSGSIAKWTGSQWQPLGLGLGGRALALATFDTDASGPLAPALIVAGEFTTAGGITAQRLARWNGMSWSNLGNFNAPVRALLVFDDGAGPALYAAGDFTQINGQNGFNRVARLSAGPNPTWTPLTPMGIGDGSVHSIAVFDDALGPAVYFAGTFTTVNGITGRNRIARWDPGVKEWGSLQSGIAGAAAPAVFSLASFDGDGPGGDFPSLFVGGTFASAGGIGSGGLAQWSRPFSCGNFVFAPPPPLSPPSRRTTQPPLVPARTLR